MFSEGTLPDLVAAEIMTSPAIACHVNAYFEEVADLLADEGISGAPVVDDHGTVIGVISERDLAHALGGPLVRLCLRRPLHRGTHPQDVWDLPRDDRRVETIMSRAAITARPETPLHTLAEIMFKEQINRIPILNHGRLEGIVSRGDILAAIAGLKRHAMTVGVEPKIVYTHHDERPGWSDDQPDP